MTEQTKHDRIFLQVCDERMSEWYGDVTWCEDRVHNADVEFIRADIVKEQLAAKDAVLLLAKDALNKWGQPHGVEAWMEARAAIDKELWK